MKLGLQWDVGDGSSINAWSDPWISGTNGPLPPLTPPPACNIIKVSDLILHEVGSWNFNVIAQLWPHDYAIRILSMPITTGAQDSQFWALSKTGGFTVKYLYKRLDELSHPSHK
ncbi:hypothetical protein FRX31_012568, partial [Thalictrum thalictroides]